MIVGGLGFRVWGLGFGVWHLGFRGTYLIGALTRRDPTICLIEFPITRGSYYLGVYIRLFS